MKGITVAKPNDETDAKTLKTLLRESRTSFTEIAKNCKISISAVRMRYKRLWKLGIINGEVMQVNPYSLGYKCICIIGVITAIENEGKVKEFLKSKPHLLLIPGAFGKYNIFTLAALHNIQELNKIQEELEANPLIKHVVALNWAEALSDHPENLVIKPFTGKNEQKATQSHDTINYEETRIDETDRKIAKILSQNSRTPFRKIAEQLNISTKNVIQRYRRLRGNVLTLSTITVDLNKLGYKAQADLFIKVENRSKIPAIHAQLLQTPNIIVIVRHIGPCDLFATAVLADFEEFFKMKENVHRIQGIEKVYTFLIPALPAWPICLFGTLL